MKQTSRKPWGDSRKEFVRVREDVLARLERGDPLSAIHRDLDLKMGYSTLAYHVKRIGTAPAPVRVASPIAPTESDPTAGSRSEKLARLRQLGEKAGHYGKRAVYDPTANSHEDLFGPPKEIKR